ncbi:thioredoxin [Candidatus Levyibacteriota bacterium]|nr:thioredoxin [Candidatus Levybacteria bacterium]GDX62171.1 thioredoxin [Candidatus Levybacteria bacterium]
MNFTDKNFQDEVLNSDIPVLVDFWAPWCGPCRMVTPIIEELANEYKGKVLIGKMNVDENQDTASKYSIMSIPSILIFKKGKPVKTMVGAQGKESFKKGIDEIILG